MDRSFEVETITSSLIAYCEKQQWLGWDPYDALNSLVLRRLPLFRNGLFRFAATQLMKRSRINFRPFLRVPKVDNPKGCALQCSAMARLRHCGFLRDDAAISARVNRLLELRSPDSPYSCWGYSFDWQSRAFLVPKFSPNIICTTFAGNALLDVYEQQMEQKLLDAAASAGEFVIHGLNMSHEGDSLCLSYTPNDQGKVHNANLLGAAFLMRLFKLNGNDQFREIGEKAVRFSLDKQSSDGSWPYGEHPSQRWIDNFHTGYNLMALWRISEVWNNDRIDEAIHRGFDFYVRHFFRLDGAPKYYHTMVWPIDVHSVAQSIITLCEFATLREDAWDLAQRVLGWAVQNMLSEEGYFYYQKTRFITNQIPYMRWGQSWMLYALSVYIDHAAQRMGHGDPGSAAGAGTC